MSALRTWLAEGTAQRWLTLAAVLLSLAMIGVLTGKHMTSIVSRGRSSENP